MKKKLIATGNGMFGKAFICPIFPEIAFFLRSGSILFWGELSII